MTRSPRVRRGFGVAVGLSTAAIYSLSFVPLAGSADAAALQLPATIKASAGGQVLRVQALSVPAAGIAAADIQVGNIAGTVDTSKSTGKSSASAHDLDGTALTAVPLNILAQSDQTAPPDNATAANDQMIGANGLLPLTVPGVLDLGVSTTTAHARYAADNTCLTLAPLSRALPAIVAPGWMVTLLPTAVTSPPTGWLTITEKPAA